MSVQEIAWNGESGVAVGALDVFFFWFLEETAHMVQHSLSENSRSTQESGEAPEGRGEERV